MQPIEHAFKAVAGAKQNPSFGYLPDAEFFF